VSNLFKIVLPFFLLFVVSLSAQPSSSGSLPFKIKGRVVDTSDKQPLEYCTVSLLKASDNSIVSGTITDEKGLFSLDDLKPGVYHVDISYIGFQTLRIENIKLNRDNVLIDLGQIKLSSDAKKLDEVEVTTMRSSVKYEIDKKVVNVDKQIVAGSGTAVDVLETVPSVQVGVDGNVSLRGSTSFTVFINGRMSVLDANEALRQIPAALIESIEIITNPSAKYDAEGTAGIINIILKKNRESGMSGAVNARAGNFGAYGGDATLSYNVKKFTLYVSGNYNRNPSPSFYDSEMTSQFGDSIYTTISTSERNRIFNNANGKLDVEYRLHDNHTLNVGGTLGKWWMDVYNDVDFDVSNNFTAVPDLFKSINETDRFSLYYESRIDYTGIWKKHKLQYHTSYTGRDDNEFIYNYQSRDDVVYFGTQSTEIGPAQRLRVNLDYEYKVDDKSKFEFGFLHQYNATQKEARVFFLDEPDFEFELQDQFSQDIDFKRNIRAFYGQFSTKFNKLGVQVGVRTENTNRVIAVPQDNARYVINRLDFFPSAYLSYKLDDFNQMYLNYSRRIEQPRGWYLEPNRVYVDANTLWQGDPSLDPTFISSFDFGYIRNFKKKGSFTLEGYYRYETNTIEVYTAPLEENFVIRRPANAGIAHNLGVEPRLNYPVFKWWDLDVSANIFYLNISGTLNEFVFERSSIIGIGSINNFFAITKTTRLQFDARYFSPRVVAQGKTSDYFAFNFGIRQDFLNKALSISLQLRNAFGTVYRETFTEFTGYSFYEIDTPRWPQFMVNVSYRINNYKPKRMAGGGDDDL
jgi:outer membrane receptor protein involved in Fe transport